MWKPKRAAVLLVCGALTLAGCAEPESEIEVTINSAQAEEYVSDKNTIQKEQGRLVKCTFETPENLLNIEIQAVVTVPETAIEEGEFEYSLPSVEQIEEIFTEGEKLEWVSSDDQEEVWGIASDSGSEVTYRIRYDIWQNYHIATYQNDFVKDLSDYPYTDENCPNDETAVKMQELTEQVEEICGKLGMQIRILDRNIGMEDGKYMAWINVISVMDDIPLVGRDYSFARTGCFIAEDGVSSMSLAGSFTKKNAQEVSVISVDRLLEILEEKAETGEIGAGETITAIDLIYCVDHDTRTFYPIWCLYGDSDMIFVCINAQTGEVVPYKDMNIYLE